MMADTPFVAGSLFGMRAFGVTKRGQLVGPSFSTVWKDGENEAVCMQFREPDLYGFDPTTAHPFRPPLKVRLNHLAHMHKVANQECGCGFYAYYRGVNDYHRSWTIQGIIEGYGTCTVGPRGFRCSKAKIVALVNPWGEREGKDKRSHTRRVWDWVKQVPKRSPMSIWLFVYTIYTVLCLANAIQDREWAMTIVFGALTPLFATLTVVFYRRLPVGGRHSFHKNTDHSRETWEKVKANYNVAVYPTVEEAAKACGVQPVGKYEHFKLGEFDQ